MTLWATSEQARALNRFRIEHGRAWKSKLRRCWQAATYPSETPPADVPLLQCLRNSLHFGPAGLIAWPDVEVLR